ncbi:MAG TPA: hypothetical protein VMZ31_20095 [Phycisphaerae bacterium]|nr:hypothetical protein [Phycisphaerae bacterium]
MQSPYADLAYFVGQGKLRWAGRQPGGPINSGFQFMGDVSNFAFDFSKQKMVEIEENTTGYGGTAAFGSVAIPLAFSCTLLQWSASNLALALYGTASGANPGGNVTGEALTLFAGATNYLQQIQPSAVALTPVAGQVQSIAVTQGSGYTTAPSVAIGPPPAAGVQATAVAKFVSATDITIQITNPGQGYTAAPTVTLTGGGFTTAATATATLSTSTALVEGTDYSLSSEGQFGDVTALQGAGSAFAQMALNAPFQVTAAYTYAANNGTIQMLTAAQPEIALRFDGKNVLNTNAGKFQPWSIYAKRVSLKLTKGFDLIGKKEAPLDLEGMLLFDATATSGSNYLDIIKG